MTLRRSLTSLSALALAVLLLGVTAAGCKQGEGDRCQLDTDCRGETLVCRHPEQKNALCSQTEGCQCLPPAPPSDAGPGTDAANTDAANTDAAPGTDAVPGTDAGSDAASTDAVPGTDANCDGGLDASC